MMDILTPPAVKSKKWADIEADEEFDPTFSSSAETGFESTVDKNGMKTITSYGRLTNGDTVKTEKKVKVTRKLQRINKAIYTREKSMAKFGMDSNDPDADDGSYTAVANEPYYIEIPRNNKAFELRKNNKDTVDLNEFYFMDMQYTKPTRELKMKFKALRDDNFDADDKLDGDRDAEEEETTGRYIPPAKRMGKDDKTLMQQQKEECTVRVTNLSEDVKEADISELFGTAGSVHRVYLAKHKETRFSKGFAFVTFTSRSEAAKAINTLNRHGYDNLLLNVEWAKPSSRVER